MRSEIVPSINFHIDSSVTLRARFDELLQSPHPATLWRVFAQRVLATYVAAQSQLIGMHRGIVDAEKQDQGVDLASLAASYAVAVELGVLLELHYEVRSKLMEIELLEARA